MDAISKLDSKIHNLELDKAALTAAVEAKDELIFAYDATRSPVIDRTIIDLRAEVERLKKRLEPPEFFETEVLSLEQIMPLDCRAEANAVIDAAIAEVWAKEAQIAALTAALEKYGKHDKFCINRLNGRERDCDCGFKQALKGVKDKCKGCVESCEACYVNEQAFKAALEKEKETIKELCRDITVLKGGV